MSVTTRHAPPLFRDRSRPVQVLLGGVIPALVGAVAGVLLGISAIAYLAIGLLAAVGSFLSGFEHRDAWGGADRGFVAGAIYGIALLLVHALVGTHATVSLGSFQPGLIVVTALVGMFLAAAGATREAG
ncbi:MAG TPA: hypothetical protein VHX62_01785 [Solirubrobacteraceae bacterium]|nr:hypothetical protein [Solirubrobacteraceae bacterium]